MKKAIEDLNDELESCIEEQQKYEKAIDALYNVDDFDGRSLTIEHLSIKSDKFSEKKETIRNAITALQKVCDHPSYRGAGHDSHYSYEKCTECGYEVKC